MTDYRDSEEGVSSPTLCEGCDAPIPKDARYCCYCQRLQGADEARESMILVYAENGGGIGAVIAAAFNAMDRGHSSDDVADIAGLLFAGIVKDQLDHKSWGMEGEAYVPQQ